MVDPLSRKQIIKTARSYLGTPYHHQGRVKGPNGGVDCCGLLICVARELGVTSYDIDGYDMSGDGVSFLTEFESQCEKVTDPQPGDILLLEIQRQVRHCGIMGDLNGRSIIHSARTYRGVVEHWIDPTLERQIYAAFKFPGVYD